MTLADRGTDPTAPEPPTGGPEPEPAAAIEGRSPWALAFQRLRPRLSCPLGQLIWSGITWPISLSLIGLAAVTSGGHRRVLP